MSYFMSTQEVGGVTPKREVFIHRVQTMALESLAHRLGIDAVAEVLEMQNAFKSHEIASPHAGVHPKTVTPPRQNVTVQQISCQDSQKFN